jgi:hypothetical protein
MTKVVKLFGLDDPSVDNNIKIIALTGKCIEWAMGFLGGDDDPLTGLIIGDKDFDDTILQKLNIFETEEEKIKTILQDLNKPDSEFEGKLMSLGELSGREEDTHIEIIALAAKNLEWEIGVLAGEDEPITGLILGEKEFVKATLRKLNKFDLLFKEQK